MIEFSFQFPPAFLFMAAAVLVPLLPGKLRSVFVLAVPVLGLVQLLNLMPGPFGEVRFLDTYTLMMMEVTPLRLCFAYVFVIICFVANLYALHYKKADQPTAAFFYVGSSLGVVFAGDYFTLFIYWEIMAVASAAIILARRNRASKEAGYRYILVHVAGGAILMAGIVMQLYVTDSLELTRPADGLPFWFILLGVCINAAVPPLSAWLSDAYPEASVTGSVYLTAYTTKTAVFVLALLFADTQILIWAGAIMTLYGVIFATMENDIRRLLAYHIISQVGYMVCGVGIGTALAVNGAAAHAYSHILYKALLFMGTGAVLYATGRRQMTELGGLHKKMPLTFYCYLVAGCSISGVPLFNGFISKSMIISAAGVEHLGVIELMLEMSAVGTFFSTTLKIPYYTFLGKDSGLPVRPITKNMSAAMVIAAGLCFFYGVYPNALYGLLPFQPVTYVPFTATHVINSMQLILATFLIFLLFMKFVGGHLAYTRDTNLIYQWAGRFVLDYSGIGIETFAAWRKAAIMRGVIAVSKAMRGEPQKILGRPVAETIGVGVALTAGLFALFIMLFFAK